MPRASSSRPTKVSRKDADLDVNLFAYGELFAEVVEHLIKTQAMNQTKAADVCRETVRALMCKARSKKDPMSLSLPPLLDEAWHVMILNTELYVEFCKDALNVDFLHHTTKTRNDPIEAKNKRVSATIAAYKTLYTSDPPADLWAREDDDVQTKNDKKYGSKRESEDEEFDILVGSKLTRRPLKWKVLPGTTVGELKRWVEERNNIPADERTAMTFKGKQLADDVSMQDCQIKRGSRLWLWITPLINIDRMGVYGKRGEEELDDVDGYGLAHVPGAEFQIQIQTLIGGRHFFLVRDDITIAQLKAMLFIDSGIPQDQQRLICAGRQLEDDQTLEHHRIREGAIIQMVLRLRGC